MKTTTIDKIITAIVKSSNGALSARELEYRTGLSRSSIDNAIRKLNFDRSGFRPTLYSIPTQGLAPIAKTDTPPSSWHRPCARKTWEKPTKVIWEDGRVKIGAGVAKLYFGDTREEIEAFADNLASLARDFLSVTASIDEALKSPEWADQLGVTPVDITEEADSE